MEMSRASSAGGPASRWRARSWENRALSSWVWCGGGGLVVVVAWWWFGGEGCLVVVVRVEMRVAVMMVWMGAEVMVVMR